MRSIIQKLMRIHASPLTRLFCQSQANRQQKLLFLAEDLQHVSTSIREMREMSSFLNNKKSVTQQVKEAGDGLVQEVECKAAAVKSKVVEDAIPKAKSLILDMKFVHGPAEKEREVKIPVW